MFSTEQLSKFNYYRLKSLKYWKISNSSNIEISNSNQTLIEFFKVFYTFFWWTINFSLNWINFSQHIIVFQNPQKNKSFHVKLFGKEPLNKTFEKPFENSPRESLSMDSNRPSTLFRRESRSNGAVNPWSTLRLLLLE